MDFSLPDEEVDWLPVFLPAPMTYWRFKLYHGFSNKERA
jgi:hypothetical protein